MSSLRIIVPTKTIQGGFDYKFETDPYDVKLHGILTPEQYTSIIEKLNKKLKPGRSGRADGALLVAGPLLVPLAVWGVRHSNQTRKRKRLLNKFIREFNERYTELWMRWNKQAESYLSIERRSSQSQQSSQVVHNVHAMPIREPTSCLMQTAHAELVSDVIANVEPIQQQPQQQVRPQVRPQPTQPQRNNNARRQEPDMYAEAAGLV